MGRFLLFLLFLFSSLLAEDLTVQLEKLDSEIPGWMEEWHVPGLALAVVKEGKVLLLKGYGVRHVGEEQNVDGDTLFALGSITKAFTGAAFTKLVHDQKLELDTVVNAFDPTIRWPSSKLNKMLTIRDILSHQTGLERADLLWYHSGLSQDELLQRLRYLKVEASPRSRFTYNNLTYLAAGFLMPQAAGKTWNAFIEEEFFKPLNMTRSYTRVENALQAPNIASPHLVVEGEPKSIKWENNDNIAPAGAIYSSASDMAKWALFLLSHQDEYRQMWRPEATLSEDSVYFKGYPGSTTLNYGLGWFLFDYAEVKLVEHPGMADGMNVLFTLIPEKETAIVILTNSNSLGLPLVIKYTLLDFFLGLKPSNWQLYTKTGVQIYELGKEVNQTLLSIVEEGDKPVEPSRYEGTYVNDLYGPLQLSVKDGELYLDFLAFHGPIKYGKKETFYLDFSETMPTEPIHGMLTFLMDERGVPKEATIESEPIRATWKRSR